MCVEDGLWSVMFFLHPVVANKKYLNYKLGWFFKLEKNFKMSIFTQIEFRGNEKIFLASTYEQS